MLSGAMAAWSPLSVPGALTRDAAGDPTEHVPESASGPQLSMIGPLTDLVAHGGRAEDAFSVVVPSIPGFGFSTPVLDRGWTSARTARAFDTLMRGLGYESYGVHGSEQRGSTASEKRTGLTQERTAG